MSQTHFSKAFFHQMLSLERSRTERSGEPFLLLLLDIFALKAEKHAEQILDKLQPALKCALRETDINGWYDDNRIIGIICTGMKTIDQRAIGKILSKIRGQFGEILTPELIDRIVISVHVYPEQQGDLSTNGTVDIILYPDISKKDPIARLSLSVKRGMDVALSAAAIFLLAPVFLVIAVTIKLTSDGPVFFRQERMGQNGRRFTFLKFRSMYNDGDPRVHRDYIQKYISDQQNSSIEPGLYKLKDDPRITPIGRYIRKTSLDELPQFINVLAGDMSLVGPRPPIPYECDLYSTWHRKRLLSCKPGITGLWQVMGRSHTTFDDMVRLDLKYISNWSLALDIKIMLKTPGAVFSGSGAC
ncbi:MAG: sugar transferase [Syntrophus sp. (in: bacteria)]